MRRVLLAWCIRQLARLWIATLRYHVVGPSPSGPGLVAFWHGDQLPLLRCRPDGSLVAPISMSKDGRLQKAIMKGFGIDCIDGSSSRGAVRALREMVNAVRRGKTILIAADGPKGPCGQAKPGAVFVAARCGVPIWSVSVAAQASWRIPGSWDNFKLPKPWSRVVVCFSEPWFVSEDLPKRLYAEALTRQLSQSFMQAQEILLAECPMVDRTR